MDNKHDDTTKEEEIEYIDFKKPEEPISGELDNYQADLYAEALRCYPNDETIDQADEKRLKRKLDMRILPLLGICYFFYYVDKTTLSYAAIFGIKKDLSLSGEEYSWLSSLFYLGWLDGIVSGMIWFGACVGNIVSPFFYRQEQAPTYSLGIGSLLTANCIEFLLFGVLRYAFIQENKRKGETRLRMRESGEAAALNDTAFSNMTDKQSPNFEYVY